MIFQKIFNPGMPPDATAKATPVTLVPTVLDVEASGFGKNSYPIEVGYVLPTGHTYCTLIKPEPDWTHWDEQAARIHQIPREILEERGMPATLVAQKLNADLRGQTIYSDGWANDYSWLGALFNVAEIAPTFKLESLRSLLTETEAAEWHIVKSQISTERGVQRHRASSDARLLQLTFVRIRGQQRQAAG